MLHLLSWRQTVSDNVVWIRLTSVCEISKQSWRYFKIYSVFSEGAPGWKSRKMATSDKDAAHRNVIKFYFDLGMTPVETQKKLQLTEDHRHVSRSLVYKWHKRFEDGWTDSLILCHSVPHGETVNSAYYSKVRLFVYTHCKWFMYNFRDENVCIYFKYRIDYCTYMYYQLFLTVWLLIFPMLLKPSFSFS